MRVVTTFFVAAACFGAYAALSQFVANSRYRTSSGAVLRDWSLHAAPLVDADALARDAKERAVLYDDVVVADHLEDGMVVNRMASGRALDTCDSLLFSSLRYAGLVKLGLDDRAATAWEGIESAHADKGWLRHPRCANVGTSRDMLLGLMIAFSQEPRGHEVYMQDLIKQVKSSGGYFGNGPVYVSYVTPGIARLMAMLATGANVAKHDLPEILQRGYATHEMTLYATSRGYEAHLVALTAYLEMELAARYDNVRNRRPDALEGLANQLVAPFGGARIQRQRLEWTTDRLVELDKRNLFFRYLRLRATGALTRPVAAQLMAELLGMPQFPAGRLPANCDRRADYLWQRASREYDQSSQACTKEFAGTDFVWMAGLLSEAMTPKDQALSH